MEDIRVSNRLESNRMNAENQAGVADSTTMIQNYQSSNCSIRLFVSADAL